MTPRQTRAIALAWAIIAFIAGATVWFAVPTRLFFNPTSAQIEGYTVTVNRTFPLARWVRPPIIRYIETVRSVANPLPPCTDTDEFRYSDNGKPFGQWDIQGWAGPCMNGDFHWSATWQAKLFGVIPLRPVEIELFVSRAPARSSPYSGR